MAEDRMLSDEILLGLINSKGGGGGGGTTNYNSLENKPQIGGVTLQGNKSLGDLGIKNEFIGTTAQWNALTAEQRKAYDTYQFTDDFMEGRYIYLPTIYTEEERQVGVWTDGKPLYQKTYRSIQLTNATNVTVDANFGSGNNIVSFNAVANGTVQNVRYQIPTTDYLLNANDQCYPEVRGDSLVIIVGGNWSAYTCDMTVLYTKTTDTAGSGIWTPSGEMAHHYSTDEQVIGTWIDGSTLYEKVITGFSITLQANTLKDTGINVSYISKLVSCTALGNDDISVLPVAGYKIDSKLQILGFQNGNIVDKCLIRYTKAS